MEVKNEVKVNMDKFLLEEILMLSVNGGLQTRGEKIYHEGKISDLEKLNFRIEIKEFLINRIYDVNNVRSYEEEDVKDLIRELKQLAEKNHKEILNNGKFRIGISQKIINLFLKYLWVLGKKEMPPYCPIDGIIKQKILETNRKIDLENWTKIDSMDRLMEYYNEIYKINGKDRIAEWELKNYRLVIEKDKKSQILSSKQSLMENNTNPTAD
ncbi:MAG TPA: hypothetical protein VLZ75_11220 [Chitinophagales bacterium]|nr:hypothetical protein [Chitinophagales bacterium]